MNAQQIKYARQRIEAASAQKRKDIVDKYTTPAVTLSLKEKCELVEAGKVPRTGQYGYYSLHNLWDFSEYESNQVVDQKAIDEELAKLKKLTAYALDELMLGDNEKALELIRSIEEF